LKLFSVSKKPVYEEYTAAFPILFSAPFEINYRHLDGAWVRHPSYWWLTLRATL